MKKKIMFLAAAVLIAGVSLVYAQNGPQGSRKADGPPRGAQLGQWQGMMGPALGEQLNLTEDQKAKIKSIMDEQMAKIKEIRTATEGRINAVLTPEQKTKLEQIRKEAQAKMKEKMEKDKAAPGPGSPAAK
jgi:Spy/CpxP family protein refolding chaperone